MYDFFADQVSDSKLIGIQCSGLPPRGLATRSSYIFEIVNISILQSVKVELSVICPRVLGVNRKLSNGTYADA